MSTLPVEYHLQIAGESAETLVHCHLREELSQLYECSLVVAYDLHAAVPVRWLGADARLEIRRDGSVRQVFGVVRRIEDLGSTAVKQYLRFQVVPALWHLSQRVDSRVFQAMNVPDIVRAVLRDAGVYAGDRLSIADGLRELPPREYCVQYRERDLDFVMRLLQEEGLAFYFEHEGTDGETLVIADGNERWLHVATLDGEESVPVLDDGTSTASVETVAHIDWQASLRPTGMALRDYDFSRPRAVLDLSPSLGGAPRAIYDYPARLNLNPWDDGSYAYRGHDGARQARIRHEAEQIEGFTAVGSGSVTGFMPGSAFKLRGHLRPELDLRWLLIAVEHVGHAWGDVPEDMSPRGSFAALVRASSVEVPGLTRDPMPDDRYTNRFRCMPADRPFRPARATPRPLVHGAQTAVVVGPSGEEIHVDHHGRIKVQFHWDRLGHHDERTTCWIRTSQLWAGPGWGAMFIPRIGMEVVVTFLEGDPDRPLVTGCVYNGQNGVPYPLPEEKTKSTIKTNSSPTNGGYNELRFEDRRGSEQVYLQAERDWDSLVKHDQTLTVKRHRTKLVEGRERNTIIRDRTTTVQQNDSLTVVANQDVHVQGDIGRSTRVDTHDRTIADASLRLECGESVVLMEPQRITLSAPVIQMSGGQLINIRAPLVKINCDGAPALTGGGIASLQSKSESAADSSAQGGGGGRSVLRTVGSFIDPTHVTELLGGSIGGFIDRLSLPLPLSGQLKGLANNVIGELATSLAEGRRPSFAKMREDAISAAVGVGVDTVFTPIENLPGVQKNVFLKGMVQELKGTANTSGTYGVLVAADIHAGLSKDPLWQTIQDRHGRAVGNLLLDVAFGASAQQSQSRLAAQSATGSAPKSAALVKTAQRSGIEHAMPTVLAS